MHKLLRYGLALVGQVWGLCLLAQSPGAIDVTFGDKGRVQLQLDQDEYCSKVLIDAEGYIYVCGSLAHYGVDTDLDFFVCKLSPDGVLDQQFGQMGVVRGDFAAFKNSRIVDADLQGGALYLIGEGNNAGAQDTQRIFVGKLDLDGQWDLHFGVNGLFSQRFLGEYASAGAVTALPDGRIVYCGMTDDTLAWHIELPLAGRLLADGRPDSSFGGTGCIAWSLAHGLDALRRGPRGSVSADARARVSVSASVSAEADHEGSRRHNDGGKFEALLPIEGGYLFCGAFYTSSYGRAMFMMVDENGFLDDGFGENGLLFADISPGFTSNVIAAHKHGADILLGATVDVYQRGEDFALLRMDSVGSMLDYQAIDFQGNEDRVQAMLRDRHGRILLAGHSKEPQHTFPSYRSDAFAVAALADFDAFAPEFGNDGQVLLPLTTDLQAGANALCETIDGKLLVAGFVATGQSDDYSDIMLMRLLLDSVVTVPPAAISHDHFFPNPATDRIYMAQDSPIAASILDASGRVVWQGAVTSAGIDVASLPAGVYALTLAGKAHRFVKL
jgi:uncharacterized delta-60 repeat protein